MVKPTHAGLCLAWPSWTQSLAYWQWRRRIDHDEFTVSFEILPELVGKGLFPGVQLLDASGRTNLASLVLAAGRSTVNADFDNHALAIVVGDSGWTRTSEWGDDIGRDEWIRAALQVCGRRVRGVIRDKLSQWFNLAGEPRVLRVGVFSASDVQVHVQPGRCTLRSLRLKRGVQAM
jgi:hypothetical protein